MTAIPTGIVLLEGADASGKTTLARHLVDRYGAKYLHSTVRRDVWRYHTGALRLAVRHSENQLVVMDRHWISELVYGAVFRGAPAYDVGARCFDRVLRRYGAVTVLCAPINQREQARRWAVGREAGKKEHFDRVREVIQRYFDLAEGNVAHPGNGYLDQLIRFQDFNLRDDVLVYDIDLHGIYPGPSGIEKFGRRIIDMVERLQSLTIPRRGYNLAGRADVSRPATLFVGEAIARRYASPPWPWCDRDDRKNSALWFNTALHLLKVREDRCVFTNALQPDGSESHLLELLSDSQLKVIALGEVAARAVTRLGRSATVIPHPSWHKRFRHAEGPAGYAEILQEALR
jgi:thymidylate kinase